MKSNKKYLQGDKPETLEEVKECAILFLAYKNKIEELQQQANVYKDLIGNFSTEPLKISTPTFKISVSESYSKKTDYTRMIKDYKIDKNKYTTQSEIATKSIRITPVQEKKVS